jgi:hypothetical protein
MQRSREREEVGCIEENLGGIPGPHCCSDICAGGATITTAHSGDLRDGFGTSLNKVCKAGWHAQYQEYG